MGIDAVRAFLKARAPDISIIDQVSSTATVLIAKTLSLRIGDHVVSVVASGDARLANRKVKDALGARPRVLAAEEVERLTGHPVGGVCPSGMTQPLAIYYDLSLPQFADVYPAAVRAPRQFD